MTVRNANMDDIEQIMEVYCLAKQYMVDSGNTTQWVNGYPSREMIEKDIDKMSLIKNDIPILEYDTNSKAVIMPGHSTNFHFPEKAVMLFMETEIDDYAMTNKCD